MGVLGEHAERFVRIRRIRRYPFCVMGEYAHLLSACQESTQKSFRRILIFYYYAERISAYSRNTQKEYQRILVIRRKDISVISKYAERI